MAKIVLPLRGGPPPEPPFGGLGEAGWVRGFTFYDFVQRAEQHRAELESAFRECPLPAAVVASLASFPRQVRVLALLDAGDPASCRFIARAERVFTHSARIWMRVFDAPACADLVARYAPQGKDLPVLVFFGEDQQEFARHRLSDIVPAATDIEPGSPEGAAKAEALALVHALHLSLATYAASAS